MRRRSVPALGLALLAGCLLLAASAQASFHLMKIREVGHANPTDYVELQMYASGENFVGGHYLRTYDETGAELSTFQFPANVAEGGSQRTILVARDPVPMPVTPDFVAATSGGTNDLAIASDGAVCYLQSIAPVSGLDCVSYGAFAGFQGGAPSPTGGPASELPAGMSLQRSIAAGCPTLLEPGDDSGDSATDFALTAGSPRNNATPPIEMACMASDRDAPRTQIAKKPKRRTTKRRVRITFSSSEPGSSFACKLDKKPFKPCRSPYRKRVGIGRHRFQVVATDAAGNTDPSPAKLRFRRVRPG